MSVCAHMCAIHMCGRPMMFSSFLYLVCLFICFEARSLSELEACGFSETGCPRKPWDPSVTLPTTYALELQESSTVPNCYMGSGDLNTGLNATKGSTQFCSVFCLLVSMNEVPKRKGVGWGKTKSMLQILQGSGHLWLERGENMAGPGSGDNLS